MTKKPTSCEKCKRLEAKLVEKELEIVNLMAINKYWQTTRGRGVEHDDTQAPVAHSGGS